MRSVGCGDRSSGPPLAPTVAMGAGGGWSYAGGGPSGAPGKPWFRKPGSGSPAGGNPYPM